MWLLSKCTLSVSALSFILLSACQHQPTNKVGKDYDANSFRCTWDESYVLAQVERQHLEQTGQQADVFQQQVAQQEAQLNKHKDCEPKNSFRQRKKEEANF